MVFSSSWMFAFVTAVFQYIIKFNSSPTACRSTTQACIVFFLFTKVSDAPSLGRYQNSSLT